jgi:hypothetical protein
MATKNKYCITLFMFSLRNTLNTYTNTNYSAEGRLWVAYLHSCNSEQYLNSILEHQTIHCWAFYYFPWFDHNNHTATGRSVHRHHINTVTGRSVHRQHINTVTGRSVQRHHIHTVTGRSVHRHHIHTATGRSVYRHHFMILEIKPLLYPPGSNLFASPQQIFTIPGLCGHH